MNTLIGLLIPFAGTSLGAAAVFFMKNGITPRTEKALSGFAAGVMTAASVWSLLIPSIELAPAYLPSWLPACMGFSAGIAFLLLIEGIVRRLRTDAEISGKENKSSKKNFMLMFAVTLHNIPEGMAVGVAFSGAMSGGSGVTEAAAMAISIGIAIQNFPEGAIISMPLQVKGMSKPRAFWKGVLSGAVEPVSAVAAIVITAFAQALMPYLLAFAAGAMIYVVVEELIPEANTSDTLGTSIFFAVGFLLMMSLDVALS